MCCDEISVHLPLLHRFRRSSATGFILTLSRVLIVCNRASSWPAEQNYIKIKTVSNRHQFISPCVLHDAVFWIPITMHFTVSDFKFTIILLLKMFFLHSSLQRAHFTSTMVKGKICFSKFELYLYSSKVFLPRTSRILSTKSSMSPSITCFMVISVSHWVNHILNLYSCALVRPVKTSWILCRQRKRHKLICWPAEMM